MKDLGDANVLSETESTSGGGGALGRDDGGGLVGGGLDEGPHFRVAGDDGGGKPEAVRASVMTGPIDAIAAHESPARTARSMPRSPATARRWSNWMDEVNSTTSNSPAARRRAASRRGSRSSGISQR